MLGFLAAIGPLSIDMSLPAFPAIEASFGEPPGTAQITLAAFFAGLAVGQLVQGALADRFGRRGPLMAGLLLYTLASAGCALAPNMATLSIMRALAAVGGSASMVIPRAIVRDLADGDAAAQLMSKLMLVMGLAPILAPVGGGMLLRVGPWPLIFWFDLLYGSVCLLIVWRALPETLPARAARGQLTGLLPRYVNVLRDRGFVTHALCSGCAMIGLFAFIGGSPPVFIGTYGVSPLVFGVLFGLCAAGFIVGSQINQPLVRRYGRAAVLRGVLWFYLASTSILAAFAFTGAGGLVGVVLPVMFALGCLGLIVPNSAVGALSGHAKQAGLASALIGMLQFVMAAVSGSLVGWLTDGTARAMAALMVAGAVCAILLDRLRPDLPGKAR